jgi:signal transduction histidine kinase
MELWTVGNKTILLIYVIIASYFGTIEPTRWLVFYFLLYLALNLIVHILKDKRMKQGIILLIIIYLIGCAEYVHPYFVLLLPLSAYELASFYIRRQGILLLIVLLPMLFMQHEMLALYAFIAVLSFFNYVMIRQYMAKVNIQEDETERMRHSHQRLTKKLSENQDFIRVSEYTVKLEERNRLAQEIHDGIGHAMTGALIQMEAAKRLLASDPDSAQTLLQNAIGISKEGIEEIRLTLKNKKPQMEQLGLSRLKTMVETFGAQAGLLTTIVHEGDMEIITPLQWKIIHENATESLTNAAKYADASAVHVEVRVLNRFIKSVVSDNGRGVSKVVKGLGLIGMEERTAAVNGTVIADGTRGFIVTTLIPYEAK